MDDLILNFWFEKKLVKIIMRPLASSWQVTQNTTESINNKWFCDSSSIVNLLTC